MLKVAIVGCGKIADAHVTQIQNIPGCTIVGVCDYEPLMAQQLYERFPIKAFFSNLETMLEEAEPDVVHITTPPESHYMVARTCLEHGSHVYIEKPFTVFAHEAQELFAIAETMQRLVTVGHNLQFSHVARRLRSVVDSGYLGGTPLHMESYYCYDLGDPSYARALLGDNRHWVRRLPGKLLQNIISHGIARISEFLVTDEPQVIAHGFVSSLLQSIGETDIVDELRVIIQDNQTTAYFTFSSQMRPCTHEFRIYGSKNGLILDQDHEVLLKLRGKKFKSYADMFVPPVLFAKQHLGNAASNARLFLKRDFQMDAGMRFLITSFYDAICDKGPIPIPYSEILRTSKIMDSIFEQIARSLDKSSAVGAEPTGSAAVAR
jgi:predicted dehydrogenase